MLDFVTSGVTVGLVATGKNIKGWLFGMKQAWERDSPGSHSATILYKTKK